MKMILQSPIWAQRVIYIKGSVLKDADMSRAWYVSSSLSGLDQLQQLLGQYQMAFVCYFLKRDREREDGEVSVEVLPSHQSFSAIQYQRTILAF
jgi:hypothetical protein